MNARYASLIGITNIGGDPHVLLLHVADSSTHPAFFQPITGGIEAGETPETACIREIFEETGIIIQLPQILAVNEPFEVIIDDSLTIRKTLFYTWTMTSAIRINPIEHTGATWMALDHIEEALFWESNRQTCASIPQTLQTQPRTN